MPTGRFVVLGLALARSSWFRAVAQWSHSASIPVEFVKCVSATELGAHLASGRAFSALLIDGGVAGLDRDLVDRATDAGCAVIVVDDVRVTRDWTALGAAAVVNPLFERKDLLEVLAAHATEIGRGDVVPGDDVAELPVSSRAKVAMVCGPGGTGASTAAIALAQALAEDVRYGGMVLLADLALHGEQAMLHDARDVVPGVQELVEAHRTGRPTVEEVRALAFDVHERRYQLLLGLRRSRNWSAVRPRAFAAGFDSLTRGWRAIVADTDADLEGEAEGGSVDIEDRHRMARTVASRADAAFVVGRPGMKGVHGLVRVVHELLDHGVDAERILPVVNLAPKGGRSRAELSGAIGALLRNRTDRVASPIFLPERRVDDALRDGIRLPSALGAPLAGAFLAVLERSEAASDGPAADGLEPIEPGTLGRWSSGIAPEPA
jgi:hypothetical protein